MRRNIRNIPASLWPCRPSEKMRGTWLVIDLTTALGDYDKTIWQGLNGPIWALIALDSGNYAMPVNQDAKTQAARQMYIDRILARQLSDGGWSLSGAGVSDPGITGMALQALASSTQRGGPGPIRWPRNRAFTGSLPSSAQTPERTAATA